jgi:Ca-activated chloride channel family protein
VVLPPTIAGDASTILASIDELQPGGSTNLEAGLRMGYDLARRTMTESRDRPDRPRLRRGRQRRADRRRPDPRQIREDAANGSSSSRSASGWQLQRRPARTAGRPRRRVLRLRQRRDEAEALVPRSAHPDPQSVALDAKAQVTFDRERRRGVPAPRLREPGDRRIRDFSDPGVDAGAIGSGHSVTALYALRLAPISDRRSTSPPSRSAGPTRIRAGPSDRAGRPDQRLRLVLPGAGPALPVRRIVAATAQALHGDAIADISLRDVADIADRSGAACRPRRRSAFLDFLDRVARR